MGEPNRLNMELDLQSLFGLHVQFVNICTHWLGPPPATPPSPAFRLKYDRAIDQPR